MKKAIILGLVFLSGTAWAATPEEVNRVGNKGLELIQAGQSDEGLAQLKNATQLAPGDASWRMNYGSMLFTRGQQLMDGQPAEAGRLFDEAYAELSTAAGLFDQQENAASLRAHCFFLLGDLEFYVRNDPKKARQHYTDALKIDPGHAGAKAALERI